MYLSYTKWGWTTCPTTNDTELIYKGKAAGSHFTQTGGGANYIFLPYESEFLYYTPGIYEHQSNIYGAEYQSYVTSDPFTPLNEHNVPCVVCYVSTRISYLMIPAKTTCPKTWTTEYQGYLMAERSDHKINTVYECVDKDAESIPGSVGNTNGALFYHVQAQCNGLLCPPYGQEKELAYVVCTKWTKLFLNCLTLIVIMSDLVIWTWCYNCWNELTFVIKAVKCTC